MRCDAGSIDDLQSRVLRTLGNNEALRADLRVLREYTLTLAGALQQATRENARLRDALAKRVVV